MDQTRVDKLLQFILAVSSEADERFERSLSPIHLIKYVYLVDLAYFARKGELYTGIEWKFHKFGPWSYELCERIEPALLAVGAEKITRPSTIADDYEQWLMNEEDAEDLLQISLPMVVDLAVKRNLGKFTNDTSSLLHYVYATKPMLAAAPGEALDFSVEYQEQADVVPQQEEIKPSLSKTKLKKRKERLAAIKAEFQKRIQRSIEREDREPEYIPPRYDEVFFAGKEWLDSLSESEITPIAGQVSFSDDVWKSKARYDPDVS